MIIGIVPGTIYYYFAPVIFLFLGITLLCVTNYSRKIKLIFIFLPFIIIPLCLFIWKSINTVEPEIILISKNYRGKVRILYNQKCGEKTEYENGKRIYKIPSDGVLLTQFKDEQGFINQEYYIVNHNRRFKVNELKVQDFNDDYTIERNPNEPPRNKLAIFFAGRTYSDGSSEFYICTYNELKKMDFKYDQKFDSLINLKEKTLKKYCR